MIIIFNISFTKRKKNSKKVFVLLNKVISVLVSTYLCNVYVLRNFSTSINILKYLKIKTTINNKF